MLSARGIALAACALALSSAASAQPAPEPPAPDSNAFAGAIEARIAEERARYAEGKCGPDEMERVEAINRDALALARSVKKAFLIGAPLDRTNGKAALDAANHAQQLYEEAKKGCVAPPPKQTPAVGQDGSDTIVEKPSLAPADVVPPRVNAAQDADTTPRVELQLEQRLRQLQESIRNSYCVTPELRKQVDDLRRDLDKATRGLDMKNPVDRYRLDEHRRLSGEISDLERSLGKLPKSCAKTEQISPVEGPPQADDRFPPPTRPLGGTDLGANCNEKDRIDERLKLQEDLLGLQDELIRTDGTTPAGRARQLELQREIKRITDLIEMLKQPCPPHAGATAKPHGVSDDLTKSRELIDVGETSHQNERPAQPAEAPRETDNRFPPPTTPLGGRQTAGCTDKQRTDERLRLQEEVLKLEGELIRTDGTTPTGRERQVELQREIKHATDEMDRLKERCPHEIASNPKRVPDLARDIGTSRELVDVGETTHQYERPSKAQPDGNACEPAEGSPRCTVEKKRATAKEEVHLAVPVRYEILAKHLAYIKQRRLYVVPTSGAVDEQIAQLTRIVDGVKDLEPRLKRAGMKIDPDSQQKFFEDIADWLDELEYQVDIQPLGPLRVPSVAGITPAEPSLESRIGELAKILKLINDDRARYGVPPLKWNDQLAQHAQEWADQLARMGKMTHAPRDGRGVERENLAQGLPWWSVERMIEEWRGEEKDYVPGKFPNVARDGDWQKVAHWTQDISRLSQEIGCAIAKGSGFLWLDCRFSPGGNKDGEEFGMPVSPPTQR